MQLELHRVSGSRWPPSLPPCPLLASLRDGVVSGGSTLVVKVGSLGCGGDFRPVSDSLHCCCSSGATRALRPLGVPANSLLTLGVAE